MGYDLRVKSCLGYFKISQAVKILGFLAIIGMVGDFASGNPIIGCVRAIEVAAFLALLHKDDEFRRMVFFYAFVFSCVVSPALVMCGVEGFSINMEAAANRSCRDLKKDEMK